MHNRTLKMWNASDFIVHQQFWNNDIYQNSPSSSKVIPRLFLWLSDTLFHSSDLLRQIKNINIFKDIKKAMKG